MERTDPRANAKQDANQNYTIIGVRGTLGDTDTGGTALPMKFSGNPNTGAMYVEDLSGGAGTTNIQGSVIITGGTIENINNGSITVLNPTGTVNVIDHGTVTITNPTGTTVTVDHGTITLTDAGTNVNIISGSLTGTFTVSNPGTTVNVATGSQQTLGTVGTVLGLGSITNIGSLTNGGTIKEVTTIANLTNGSINILTGSIQSSGTTTGIGTVTNLGSVTSVGTAKEITTVANLTNGSVNILTGTIQNSGSTTGVGVVSNLTNGSVNILSGSISGTLLGGTIQNLNAGTITLVSTVTTVSNLTNGSVNILSGSLSGTVLGGTLGNLNNGTLALVTTVSNLTNGSINILTGTQQLLGTVQLGTMKYEPTTIPQMLQMGTLGTAGGSFFATISAASGAGTKQYIQGVDIVVQSGTPDVRVLVGTVIQGTGVLAAGQFVPSAGIAKNWSPHFNTGTNSEITYHFVGAGTAFINVSYWKGA